MVCLGLEPGVAGWKVQTNPLCYGGTPSFVHLWSFQTPIQVLKDIIWKIMHLVYDKATQIHDL